MESSIDQEPLMGSIHCLVYNHEPFLRQCLEGFVMQKASFRFEAIVHDDASTDGSTSIIRDYAKKYPDIIKPIFETENQYSKKDGSLGKIMAQACVGKYVALCEGDDYWNDPLKLQVQVDYMECHPECGLCYSNFKTGYRSYYPKCTFFRFARLSSHFLFSGRFHIEQGILLPTKLVDEEFGTKVFAYRLAIL